MAVDLKLYNDDGRWDGTSSVFEYLEHIFNILFVLELMLRFLGDGS